MVLSEVVRLTKEERSIKGKVRCTPHQLPGIPCMNRALDKNSGSEEIVHPCGQ